LGRRHNSAESCVDGISQGTSCPTLQALFDGALEDMRKAGAQILDPVLSGIDLARQSDSSSIGAWPYEVIIAGDVYLKRLGPKRPFKTMNMKKMITTVGPDKFVDSYVSAPSYPPPEEDPGFMRRYRGRQAIRNLVESLLTRYDYRSARGLYEG